jgi:heme/copper-type cytochrome/quinol oxidase subunit 2
MKTISLARRAIALPLIGLVIAWLFFMVAQYSDLYVSYDYAKAPEVKLSTYLFLAGIAIASIAALIGQNLAIQARLDLGEENRLARAAHRFGNLAVIIGLAAGAVYAITNFLSAFNLFQGRTENLGLRFLGVYLPILLATALVVTVLLRAFVFRKDLQEEAHEDKKGLSEAQKALGLGYAVPILATAAAIIFGLVVYDVTRTDLEVWVWVIIQVIVVIGIVAGTKFASKAKAAKPAAPRPRTALAAGAATLNFVLSIVFGVAVTSMAFTFGSAAIEKLRVWPQYIDDKVPASTEPTISLPTFIWFIDEMLPALVLLILAVIGIYWTLTERNKEPEHAGKETESDK